MNFRAWSPLFDVIHKIWWKRPRAILFSFIIKLHIYILFDHTHPFYNHLNCRILQCLSMSFQNYRTFICWLFAYPLLSWIFKHLLLVVIHLSCSNHSCFILETSEVCLDARCKRYVDTISIRKTYFSYPKSNWLFVTESVKFFGGQLYLDMDKRKLYSVTPYFQNNLNNV